MRNSSTVFEHALLPVSVNPVLQYIQQYYVYGLDQYTQVMLLR